MENLKISMESAFFFWAMSQNENAELTKFLEKVNSGEMKVIRVTSFAKNRLWIYVNMNFLPKYKEEEIFSSIKGGSY